MDSVKARQSTALQGLLSHAAGRVVIYGAGNLGRQAVRSLRRIGLRPLAVADRNPARVGSELCGCPILSPDDAAHRYGSDALFIVAVWNNKHYFGQTKNTLLVHGAKRISSVSPVYWRFADELLPYFCQDLPHKVYEAAGDVLAAASVWGDEKSKTIYSSKIRWRALGDWDCFNEPEPEESYFTESLFALSPNEDFVDCGAFDGDTIKSLLQRQGSHFGSILALEADPVTYTKLAAHLDNLDPAVRRKIETLQAAVGLHIGKVRFAVRDGGGSAMNDSGNTEVECFRLDQLLRSRHASYIKMDIEGAEYDALMGAMRTIQRDRPVVSVCVYHTQSDIWRLPLLLRSRVENYAFFLREHEGDGWQTVLYGVPYERMNDRQSRVTHQQTNGKLLPTKQSSSIVLR